MDMAAVEPRSSPQFDTPSFSLPSEESYKPLLQESVHHLLLQLRAGASDFSHFHLIFSRLVQTIPSPPVEIIWFYAAVNFHSHKAVIGHRNTKARVSALRDLFQLLVSCSDSCSALKRIGVLAPLVFELYNLVLGLKKNSSFEGDICGEIDCLLERVVSYISLCCCSSAYVHDSSQTLSCCFVDLVRVWTFDGCERELEQVDYFKVLFPAVSSEVHLRLREGCGVGYLAGVVMLESFMLRLCLKLGSRSPERELVEAATKLAGDMITGFRNCYFFDILLEMLLEPTISITCPLSYDDEVLQKVLFNAVMILDYPFSHSGSEMQPCSNHLKGLALSWLFVAENALSFLRKQFGESQADAYARGFFISLSRSWLMRWLVEKLCIEEIIIQRISSSPSALFDWISELRHQVSDSDISKLLGKMAHYRSRMRSEHPEPEPGGDNRECDNLCSNDHAALEMVQSVPRFEFCSEENDRGRKRKDVTDDEAGLQHKMLKYQFCDDSFSRSFPFHNGDGWVRKNENESSSPDEDMEIMVQ